MNPIIPTIFAQNKKEFQERFNKLIHISKNLQIDFMDRKFVPSNSISISQIPNLKKYKNNFEAHLMVKSPESWIKSLKQKGFRKIIIHYESVNPQKALGLSKKNKLITFIAINPETPIKRILPFLRNVDGILFMGVHPGKEHQKFISSVYKKIKQLKKINKKILIQVDGGVNEKNISRLAKAGVNYVNSGSLISDSKNPKETYRVLSKIFKTARRKF